MKSIQNMKNGLFQTTNFKTYLYPWINHSQFFSFPHPKVFGFKMYGGKGEKTVCVLCFSYSCWKPKIAPPFFNFIKSFDIVANFGRLAVSLNTSSNLFFNKFAHKFTSDGSGYPSSSHPLSWIFSVPLSSTPFATNVSSSFSLTPSWKTYGESKSFGFKGTSLDWAKVLRKSLTWVLDFTWTFFNSCLYIPLSIIKLIFSSSLAIFELSLMWTMWWGISLLSLKLADFSSPL